MKHLITTASLILLLFSCKKENSLPIDSVADNNVLFFQKVKSQLKDSLSSNDYTNMDTSRMYKSKDAQSKGCFVRIGLLNRDMATDFILLKTDTLGTIRQGKIVHVDKEMLKGDNKRFGGRFAIASLNRSNTRLKAIVSGKFKSIGSGTDLMEAEQPAGEQTLPDCVITCYSTGGDFEGDWYCYEGFYDDFGGGDGGAYTYGYSGDGDGSSATSNEDNTMVVEVESNDDPAIKVEDYIQCFSSVPDEGATYQVTIFSDIPVNNNPGKMFEWATGSPGHSFIQLTKSSDNFSIQQSFGFYPQISWQILTSHPCASKIVDNGGHRFDASLTQTISSSQFEAVISKLELLENTDYSLSDWNCTDFAMSIYNAASYNPLTIPQYSTEGDGTLMNTPQGLYKEITMLQASGNTAHGIPSVPKNEQEAGNSHGSCGQ